MTRELTAGQQTELGNNPYRLERLIEIKTPAGSYYYTTGLGDTQATTPTSGTQTFLANNGVQIFGEIGEIYDFGVNEVVIQVGDVSNTVHDNLTRLNNNYDFARTDVHVYYSFRSVVTGAVSSNLIPLYSGKVYKVDVIRDTENMSINLRCSSQFSNFNQVNGRTVSDFPSSLVVTNIQFGNRKRS